MFCREQAVQLQGRVQDIREAGAELIAIGNGSRYFAEGFIEEFGIDFPVYLDKELGVYKAAGLERGILAGMGKGAWSSLQRARQAGARQKGVQGDAWQQGGAFVLAPGNTVLFEHRNGNFGDHVKIDEVLAALERKAA